MAGTPPKKTSIYLQDEHLRQVVQIADRLGVSQAWVIRQAITRYAEQMAPRREFTLDGSGEGPGGSLAGFPEEELLAGFGA